MTTKAPPLPRENSSEYTSIRFGDTSETTRIKIEPPLDASPCSPAVAFPLRIWAAATSMVTAYLSKTCCSLVV